MKSIISSIELNLANNPLGNGLSEVRMKKLGPTVVLAGANGSGKTRLLNLVRNYASTWWNRGGQDKNIMDILAGITRRNSQNIQVHDAPTTVQQMHSTADARRGDAEGARNLFLNSAADYGNSLQQAMRMVQAIADDFIDTGNQLLPLTTEEIDQRVKRWHLLRDVVGSMLNCDLAYDRDRYVTIDGLRIDNAYSLFSAGQKKLFAFAVTLSGRTEEGVDRIIIFDEPETALHPEAAIRMIKSVEGALDNAQLWIATHSVPLIAGLGLETVWCAEKGRIYYGGQQFERVINSLLGGRDNLFSLRNAIAEPDRIAMAKFAAECLSEPHAVDSARPNDPQMQQFTAGIEGGDQQSDLSVLDWGAGRGRLKIWLTLHSNLNAAKLSYFGYEPDATTAKACIENIGRVTGADDAVIWSHVEDALDYAEKHGGFDFVVMANVLHEVEPSHWLRTFSLIARMLKPNGHLLVLEDSWLPVGELPHLSGFLLVDHSSCTKLFGAENADITLVKSGGAESADRLTCLKIPQTKVANVTESSVRDCICHIRNISLDKLGKIRSVELASPASKGEFMAGHFHALALLQYANASLALESIS